MLRRQKVGQKLSSKKSATQCYENNSIPFKLTPLGALAAGFGLTALSSLAYAQTPPAIDTGKETQLSTVTVKAGLDLLRAGRVDLVTTRCSCPMDLTRRLQSWVKLPRIN